MDTIKYHKKRTNYLKAAYILFQIVPQVLEKHIKRTHNIGLQVAIESTQEDLRRILTEEEFSDLYHMNSKIVFLHYKGRQLFRPELFESLRDRPW